jgi:anti-sigma B factor antagonist/stage II sporulation protein AA (anti-sigma F factor antagonist)
MMDLHPTRQDKVLLTRPAGNIDQASADDFLAALRAALASCQGDGSALLVDFAEVDYISSVGLRALMLTAREAKAAGVALAVAALKPLVQEIFQISRFDMVVTVQPTVAAAIAALQGGSVRD